MTRAKPASLNQLAEAYMRRQGWTGGNTEWWQGPIKRDFLGFVDSLWIKRIEPFGFFNHDGSPRASVRVVAVQSTDRGDASKRLRKIARELRAEEWLAAGGRIWLITWAPIEGVMTPRVTDVTRLLLEDWR